VLHKSNWDFLLSSGAAIFISGQQHCCGWCQLEELCDSLKSEVKVKSTMRFLGLFCKGNPQDQAYNGSLTPLWSNLHSVGFR